VRGRARDYATHHPGSGDLALVIEIADSSLSQDRNVKGPLYARAAVPVYWIVNIPDRRVEVYSDPTGPVALPAYRQRTDYGENDSVPLVLDGTEVGRLAVRDLLP
jgi:Uma2 family endonuclease